METALHPSYPATIEGALDPELSRWLWLFKWFLAIPHYIVLFFLWAAFAVLSVVAFFAILITGRYPRSIFSFNVGVLRWTWRVSYYSYGALATDRYPPFTLEDDPSFPAHLEVRYPERLSRGLVLIKWWLLAIPHYIIVGIFVGGLWFGWQALHIGGGLIGLLALVAAIMLLLTAKYPEPIFDLILGLNRWVVRVAAYSGLMTDEYPPFRLDLGGSEPGGTLTVPKPSEQPSGAPPARAGWGAGRIIAVVVGAIFILPGFGITAGGGVLLWTDLTQRNPGRFITSDTELFTTSTYAIVSERIRVPGEPAWAPAASALGTVRIHVSPTSSGGKLFVGIGPAEEIDRYLAGVGHAVTTDLSRHGIGRTIAGGAPAAAPTAQTFWVASSSGTGPRTVTWKAQSGNWSVVAMNPDRSPGVSVRASIGATVPALRGIAIGLLAGGAFIFFGSLALLIGAISRRPRSA